MARVAQRGAGCIEGTERAVSTPLRPVALVVEDDPSQAQPVIDLLKESSYQVVAARDSRTALRLLEASENAPALAILDLELGFSPHDSSEPILRELYRTHPDCRVIVWSAYLGQVRQVRALRRITAANPFMTPVEKSEGLEFLLATVRQIMSFRFGDLELKGALVFHTHRETGVRSEIVNGVAIKLMNEAQRGAPCHFNHLSTQLRAVRRLRAQLALLGSTVSIQALGAWRYQLIEIDDGELATLRAKAEQQRARERDYEENRRKR